MLKKPEEYLALALDNIHDLNGLKTLVDSTAPYIGVYKVGLEQFTRFGPSVLEIIRDTGRKIFLDLKFHDIPNTVKKAVSSAKDLDVEYLTVHCLGGLDMLKAAADGAGGSSLKIIGVTVLTSISDQTLTDELLIKHSSADYVKQLASLAVQAGIGGVVCSALDLSTVKSELPDHFEIITPGIRLDNAQTHDQKRVATPLEAIRAGSTLLVLGRAVTEAKEPAMAAKEILTSIQ